MFSETQKKIISTALSCLAVVVILLFVVEAFKLFGDFVSYFSSVIYPLVLAGVLFIMLKPIIDFLNDNLKIPRTISILILYVLLCIIFTLIFMFVVPKVLLQIESFIRELPQLLKSLINYFLERFPDTKALLSEKVNELNQGIIPQELMEKALGGVSKTFSTLFAVTGSVVGFCSILAAFAVVPIYLYYMLESDRDISEDFDKNTQWLSHKHRNDLKFLLFQFIGILSAFFRGQLIIASIMGILFGIGFSICGLKFGFAIGFIMGLLNIVPYLGSILGTVTALSIAFFQKDGGLPLVAMSIVVICIVQLIESYLLTPKIMKKQTGLHPAVIMFSIFFWGVALKGIIGMILAIPLSAFIVVFWRLIRTKYLNNSQEI